MASENVEMSEQTPLKSDTDKPAGTEETVVETSTELNEDGSKVTTTKTTKTFKLGNFFKRNKGAVVEGEDNMAATEEKTTEVVTTEETTSPKKPVWPPAWLKRGPKKEKKECDDMTIGLNMNDRDEQGINEHVKLAFEDVFGEPDTNHSYDCAWKVTFRTFNFVRSVVYKLLALILAIPAALIFGVIYAVLAVCNVWIATPTARALTIPAVWIAKTWNFIIRSIFDPIFRSVGLVCSSVHVRKYGITNDATVEMA